MDYLTSEQLDDGAGFKQTADGNGHRISENGPTVVITRTDGAVTLARPGGTVFFYLGGNVGDLDGDGRSDYVAYVYDGSSPDAAYVVSGTVSPGTHDPRDVGVRVPLLSPQANVFRGRFRGVGDQNGDGADDLALDTQGLGEGLYSGRELLARRPGTQTSLPIPFRTVDNIVSVVSMGDGEPPAIIEMFGAFALHADENDRIELRVLGKSVDCLVTTNDPVEHGQPAWLGSAYFRAWRVETSHRVIELDANIRDVHRPTYRWDLDSN